MAKKKRAVDQRAHQFDLQMERERKEAEAAKQLRRRGSEKGLAKALKRNARRKRAWRYKRGMVINGVRARNKGHARELMKEKRERSEFCEPEEAPPKKRRRMVEKMVDRAAESMGGLDLKAGDNAFVMGAVGELTGLSL